MDRKIILSSIIFGILLIGCGGDKVADGSAKPDIKTETKSEVKQEIKKEEKKGFLDSFKTDYTKIELSKIPDYRLNELEEIKQVFKNNTDFKKTEKEYMFRYKSDYTLRTKKEVRDYAIYLMDYKPELLLYKYYKTLMMNDAKRRPIYHELYRDINDKEITEFPNNVIAYLLYDNDGDAELIKRIFKIGGFQLEQLADIIYTESKQNPEGMCGQICEEEDLKITKLQKTAKIISENLFELAKLHTGDKKEHYKIIVQFLNSFSIQPENNKKPSNLPIITEETILKNINEDTFPFYFLYLSNETIDKNFFHFIKLSLNDKIEINMISHAYDEIYRGNELNHEEKKDRYLNQTNIRENKLKKFRFFATTLIEKHINTPELFNKYYVKPQPYIEFCNAVKYYSKEQLKREVKEIYFFTTKMCKFVGVKLKAEEETAK